MAKNQISWVVLLCLLRWGATFKKKNKKTKILKNVSGTGHISTLLWGGGSLPLNPKPSDCPVETLQNLQYFCCRIVPRVKTFSPNISHLNILAFLFITHWVCKGLFLILIFEILSLYLRVWQMMVPLMWRCQKAFFFVVCPILINTISLGPSRSFFFI